jgi:hypothetical protein
MTTELVELLEACLGEGPPHRSVEERLAAGRRAVRRRRRAGTAAVVVMVAALGLTPVLARTASTAGGGGHHQTPTPSPIAIPGHVRLFVAPPRYVEPDTPPVLYLFGRMFRRDRSVEVLAAAGDVDQADHPRGAAIVRVGDRTTWVIVAGNEPDRISEQVAAPYDYHDFTTWALGRFASMTGHLALSATAPGPFAPPVLDADSPAAYAGPLLLAKPGGTVVQRIRNPVRNRNAVPGCDAQAVRVHTGSGDWFVLGDDCEDGYASLYTERAGVRADTLATWLVRVKKAQDEFVR